MSWATKVRVTFPDLHQTQLGYSHEADVRLERVDHWFGWPWNRDR